jgi:hypothetical protein
MRVVALTTTHPAHELDADARAASLADLKLGRLEPSLNSRLALTVEGAGE